jgi:hypothetical protein
MDGTLALLGCEVRLYLAIVDANNAADHFWHDDHVSEVCLDDGWFFVGWCLFLRFSQLLDEAHWLPLDAAPESTANASVDQLDGSSIGP